MSESNKADMEAKLNKLECLFTWDVKKDDIKDLDSITEKLLDRFKFFPHRYHATYLNVLAFVSHLIGKTTTALDYLRKAEEALKEDKLGEAEFVVTYSSFAWIHYHLGSWGDVEACLVKVQDICQGIPGSLQYSCSVPAVHGEKAWSLVRLGALFYERAKESFSKALEAEPDNKSYNVGYAVVLYRLEGMQDRRMRPEGSEALVQLRKALTLEPANAEMMVLLALKLQGTKKQESMKLIKEALQLSPDVPQVTRYVAKYFRLEGSFEESLEVLQKAVEQAPNSSFLHHQMGLCCKQQLIQMLSQREPGWRVPANRKAAKAMECIRHFSKAVELKPSNIYARVSLAEAYGENRQLADAERIFAHLLKDDSLRDADKQHCHAHYGLFLLYKKKDENGAVAQLKIAYKMPIDSYERKQAGKKLKQIADKLSTKQRVREEIVAFMGAVDGQETRADEDTRWARHSSDADDLADQFGKGMKLKH